MNIEPQFQISLIVFSTIIFGLIVWRISNKIFVSNNRIHNSKFDKSEYTKRWKKK